jgi:hypothetical protein
MKHFQTFTIAITAFFMTSMFATNMFTLNMYAQTAHGLPTVKDQLKVLSDKLDLTGDQQTKVEPILRSLHDATLKLMQDKSLSEQERLNKVRPLRLDTDKKLREILNDEQKKKLDAYEQGPHPEMHGDLNGKAQPPK